MWPVALLKDDKIEIIILSKDREKQMSYDATNMWNLKKNDTNELIYKIERRSNN